VQHCYARLSRQSYPAQGNVRNKKIYPNPARGLRRVKNIVQDAKGMCKKKRFPNKTGTPKNFQQTDRNPDQSAITPGDPSEIITITSTFFGIL
jgi:hypothetical protein